LRRQRPRSLQSLSEIKTKLILLKRMPSNLFRPIESNSKSEVRRTAIILMIKMKKRNINHKSMPVFNLNATKMKDIRERSRKNPRRWIYRKQ
jgi:hypothetical protein